MTPRRVIVLLAATLTPGSAFAQQDVLVTVRSAVSRAALPHAIVEVLSRGRMASTDRLGRVWLQGLQVRDTVVVAAVGFRPDTLGIAPGQDRLEVTLVPIPVALDALTVAAIRHGGPTASVTGMWEIRPEAINAVPFALQADPLRALALVPSVTFSSPLSARPIMRGYDATESVVQLDGFEIINPYHIGRIFSSFPTSALGSATVAPDPPEAATGGTLVGAIQLNGRTPNTRRVAGGVDLDFLTASGWLQAGPVPMFVSGRVAYLDEVTAMIADRVPYNFKDLYVRTIVGDHVPGTWEGTLFLSGDHFADRQSGTGMDWSNVLAGTRWRALESPTMQLDLSASINDFELGATDLEARYSRIDIENRFRRFGLGLTGTARRGPIRAVLGVTVGRREVANDLRVRSGDDFAPVAQQSTLSESHAFAEVQLNAGPLVAAAGLRVETSPSATTWQPRARLAAMPTSWLTASVVVSRASRLYQIISDPEPEPAIPFFDFWLNAGEGGTPVPRVDHVTVNLEASGDRWSVQVAGFHTYGVGLGELRPTSDQQAGDAPFRFGESRTSGIETRVGLGAVGGRGPSGALTYVLSTSERRWEGGEWLPWSLDRRHVVRIQTLVPLGTRWQVFALSELESGQPLTPVADVVWRQPPTLGQDVSTTPGIVGYRYGPEGSARSGGTFRLDLGGRVRFGGPGGSLWSIGVSVINVTVGSVAPEIPIPPSELVRSDGTLPPTGVSERRLFDLPPIPSLTLRVEF